MALIHCPECGKEISNMTQACPNCGKPIQKDTYVLCKTPTRRFLQSIRILYGYHMGSLDRRSSNSSLFKHYTRIWLLFFC